MNIKDITNIVCISKSTLYKWIKEFNKVCNIYINTCYDFTVEPAFDPAFDPADPVYDPADNPAYPAYDQVYDPADDKNDHIIKLRKYNRQTSHIKFDEKCMESIINCVNNNPFINVKKIKRLLLYKHKIHVNINNIYIMVMFILSRYTFLNI